MSKNVVISSTDERVNDKFESLMEWAHSLSKQQIDFLCDGGWYNNAINGYLIAAARNIDMDEDQISNLLQGLYSAFDNLDKQDAEKLYLNR